MKPTAIKIAEYDYDLPDQRIAKYPLEQRDQSKLLTYQNGKIKDYAFKDLTNYLPKNTLLIFNDSKVMPVRLKFTIADSKEIEIFCLEPIPNTQGQQKVQWKCFVGNARKWKDETISLSKGESRLEAKIITRARDGFTISFNWSDNLEDIQDVFEEFGAIPIPPYLNRKSEAIDTERYQNVFAHHNGSVAAPTAGLHFTQELIQDLKQNKVVIDFVTLHVGAGTFKPVSTNTIGEHVMHMERMVVTKSIIDKLLTQIKAAKTITAVGTTSLRTLESIYWLGHTLIQNENALEDTYIISQWLPYENKVNISATESLQAILKWFDTNKKDTIHFGTEIFITPNYEFKIIDCLITNFHQPKSTLLLLVAAATNNNWKSIYTHAIENDYRFLSYGDSSLLYIDKTN